MLAGQPAELAGGGIERLVPSDALPSGIGVGLGTRALERRLPTLRVIDESVPCMSPRDAALMRWSPIAQVERHGPLDTELCQEFAIVTRNDEAPRPGPQRRFQGAQPDEVEAEGGLVEDQELHGFWLGKQRDQRRSGAFAGTHERSGRRRAKAGTCVTRIRAASRRGSEIAQVLAQGAPGAVAPPCAM